MNDQARSIRLEASWKSRLADEFAQPYMRQLGEFLRRRKAAGAVIYPPGGEIFAALDHTPFERVRVVIIGQDPYHGPGQAHGLCFSVRPGVVKPPSLVNILQEWHDDLGLPLPRDGDLTPWAERGVLLLNAVLTVERGRAGSHAQQGWERFTDAVIDRLNAGTRHLVFMLWGSYAQNKGRMIDRTRHWVIESPHPSPLSAYRGFFGSRPFSRANRYLESQGLPPIDWSLP